MQKENGELTVISPTGENEDEEKQWNRNQHLPRNAGSVPTLREQKWLS
jgi:hypothetical protein